MIYNKIGAAAAFAVLYASTATAANDGGLTLLTANINQGSTVSGIGELGSEAGQAASTVSDNNFINFCSGKTINNGLQILGGSCVGVAMGDIPAKTKMVSAIITFPQQGKTVESNTNFNITLQVSGLTAGSFTDPDTTYYAAPQQLDSNGQVIGHCHVTVQDMKGDINPTTPLDPTKFAFFKGINDAGNGKGLLTAVVAGGLPAGTYRVCTLCAAMNHQPVIMPVAQRGAQDDCTKFVVVGNGKTPNVKANDGSGGIAAAALAASAIDIFNQGGEKALLAAGASASAAAAAALTTAASAATTTDTATSTKKGKLDTGGKAVDKTTAAANTKTAASEASKATKDTKAKDTKAHTKHDKATGTTLAKATKPAAVETSAKATGTGGGRRFGHSRGRIQDCAKVRREYIE